MTEKFEAWAILELFGHQRIAGLVSEQTVSGGSFIRIDVPETETQPAFTRLFNPTAIYAINPVTEELAKAQARTIEAKPVTPYDIKEAARLLMHGITSPVEADNTYIHEEDEPW